MLQSELLTIAAVHETESLCKQFYGNKEFMEAEYDLLWDLGTWGYERKFCKRWYTGSLFKVIVNLTAVLETLIRYLIFKIVFELWSDTNFILYEGSLDDNVKRPHKLPKSHSIKVNLKFMCMNIILCTANIVPYSIPDIYQTHCTA